MAYLFMKQSEGFSLIELILVIAIIGIIAAIAAPNLLSARRAANEGSAVSSLRTLSGANVTFASSIGSGRYAGTPGTVGTSSLAELRSANLIDALLGAGDKSGFSVVGDSTVATQTEPPTFYFSSNPQIASGILATGKKRFGVATDGVLRVDATLADLSTPFDSTSLQTATPVNN